MKKLYNRGFTMTELLVVIAIIGVLAAAVLSTINLVEQINKGRDTGLRSDSAEMVNAIERYFAVHEFWPWLGDCATLVAPCTYQCAWGAAGCDQSGVDIEYFWDGINNAERPAAGTGGVVLANWHWILDETDEVKPNFVERLQDSQLEMFMYKPVNEGVVYTCFQPSSNQFRSEAFERCDAEASMDALWGGGGAADTLPDVAEVNVCVFNGLNSVATGPNLICVP